MPRFRTARLIRSTGFPYLHQAYIDSDTGDTLMVTVPALWDAKARRVIDNESSDIIRMLNGEFGGIAGDNTDYYPPAMPRRSTGSTTSFMST